MLPSLSVNTEIASKCIPVLHRCSSWVLCLYIWKSKQKDSMKSLNTNFMSNWTKSSSKGQNLIPFQEGSRSSLSQRQKWEWGLTGAGRKQGGWWSGASACWSNMLIVNTIRWCTGQNVSKVTSNLSLCQELCSYSVKHWACSIGHRSSGWTFFISL